MVKKPLTSSVKLCIICNIKLIKEVEKRRRKQMVRILFNEEVHFLKKKAKVQGNKSDLIRRIVKKTLDK